MDIKKSEYIFHFFLSKAKMLHKISFTSHFIILNTCLSIVLSQTQTTTWFTLCTPLQSLLLKLQPSRVLVFRASRAICPCDRDTNDDPDRNDTGSCCHSCKRLLQVLVPLCVSPLYPAGLISLIRSQLRLEDVRMIHFTVEQWRHVLTTHRIMSALQIYTVSCSFRFCQLTITEISQMETLTEASLCLKSSLWWRTMLFLDTAAFDFKILVMHALTNVQQLGNTFFFSSSELICKITYFMKSR